MRPLIGITTGHSDNQYGQSVTEIPDAYARAITDAGGLAVLIPTVGTLDAPEELLARLDGIVFSGGGDIEPRRYGETYQGRLVEVYQARDDVELRILKHALEIKKPILGICRGIQLLNVGLGGTLYPDLATEPGGTIVHDQPGNERAFLVHTVQLEGGSRVAQIAGETSLSVNSHHHQGLKEIATVLRIAGRSPDGLVEAVEMPDRPFAVAVQWHPEWLTDQPPTRRLFRAFIDAARARP